MNERTSYLRTPVPSKNLAFVSGFICSLRHGYLAKPSRGVVKSLAVLKLILSFVFL